MSVNYANYPNAIINFSNSYFEYVIISYYGNTVATSGNIYSGNITTNTYTTPDLSFNTLYNFTITPYYNSNTIGITKNFTINTKPTPTSNGIKAINSSTANTTLQWTGSYSYVKISRGEIIGLSGSVVSYTDISSIVLSSPYYDTDLSGNTTYSYKITPYIDNISSFSNINIISLYKNVISAYDLSAVFYDTSAIQITFNTSKNNYNTSVSYTLRAINSSTGLYKDISGNNNSLIIKDLSDDILYNCYILTVLDNSYSGISAGLNVTTKSLDKIYNNIKAIPIYNNATTLFTNLNSDTYTVSTITDPSFIFGNGTYNFTASSSDEKPIYQLTGSHSINTGGWWSPSYASNLYGSTYTQFPYSNSLYIGGGTNNYWRTTINNVNYDGEYIQFKFPYKLLLTQYKFFNRLSFNALPKNMYIIGSNDGIVWEYITNNTNVSETYYSVSTLNYYSYIRFIINTIQGSANLWIVKIEISGSAKKTPSII